MEGFYVVLIVATLFVGLPWMVFHYITKWKQAPRITDEDEKMLDELYHFARRIEDRVQTIERIVAADNPDFRQLSAPTPPSLTEATDYSLSRRN
ncbi:envelope stress response membrane protein PspB [Sphingomonas donggukensis]|uniref:Envelope stress response membrane protein PspB n=1 Tax=Sphingomonas donggukensis TaxID=2949093 RepID=A0ABY4U2F9_9SPHN|nr:envelope stress response membrane protein PspB [Sphingomonas donggukensis]URW76738.1 envelope stress response membrane protein PspB [Sphingomonas donggukensis]